MKRLLPLLLLASTTFAADYPRVIFSDDFAAEGFGKAWGHYKSASIVKDGVLVGITPLWITSASKGKRTWKFL